MLTIEQKRNMDKFLDSGRGRMVIRSSREKAKDNIWTSGRNMDITEEHMDKALKQIEEI